MESIIFSGLGLLGALLLVALNGIFVAAEFAFVKIRSAQVEKMVEEGRASARIVQGATQKLDRYLAVSQLGITISSLGLGALGEPAIGRLLEPVLAALGFSESLIHAVAFATGFGIITFLHVVFGELAPKSFAIQNSEGTSLFIAPFMRIFYYLLLPGVIVFNGTANAVVRLFGVPPATEGADTYSEQEIRTLIAQSTKQGILQKDEESRLSGVFNLEDTAVREIMVPRPDVVMVPADLGLKDLITVTAAGHYTRYPVHEGEAHDRIVGSVHVKDILRAVESHGGVGADLEARDLMRDVLLVPENRSIENVLEDFQRQKIQVAVVIDEWGSFEGLVTIEDILEEIVGEIRDEFDDAEPAVEPLPDGSYAVDGRLPINVVNEALQTGFESEDFDTMGGLVLGALGRVPEVGDEISLNDHMLRVEEIDGPRVAQVTVQAKERNGNDGTGE
ncbi:MAG: hemolysin family protein [Actinomycetota bacterium]|nr:hemolysin family protein [Actinomycetota bacterium]